MSPKTRDSWAALGVLLESAYAAYLVYGVGSCWAFDAAPGGELVLLMAALPVVACMFAYDFGVLRGGER